MLINVKNQTGQSLLELLVAMSVFVLVVSSIMFLTLDAHSANLQAEERTKASFLVQQGTEAVKSVRNQGWSELTVGTFSLDKSGGLWELVNGGSELIDAKFTRQIVVEYPMRDEDGNFVDSGGVTDFDTKKVTSRVTWDYRPGHSSEVTTESYFTNWRSVKWFQTLQTEFDQGIKNNVIITATEDGEIELDQSEIPAYFDATFNDPADYTYDDKKIEVANSTAQLLSQGLVASGQTENSGFDRNSDPWEYGDWDQETGEVNVDGRWRSSGGNPDGFIAITVPRSIFRSMEVGGFWQQKVEVTEDEITSADLSFDWSVYNFGGSQPGRLELYAFVDNFEGEPRVDTAVWKSGSLIEATKWDSVQLDLTSLLSRAGTYYVKLAVWAEKQGGFRWEGPYDIGFDNAQLYWEKSEAKYPNDGPSINPADPFQSAEIYEWHTFQETAIKNGGEIYYQLSDDAGATWWFVKNDQWVKVEEEKQYNTAEEINKFIPQFPSVSQSILFKAFLVSDGSQQVILDNVRITYKAVKSFDSTFSTPTDYKYDPDKIEIISTPPPNSLAQLFSMGLLGSGNTLNSGFDDSLDPWKFGTWNYDFGEAMPSGVRVSSHGDSWGRLRVPRSNRPSNVGGFFMQPIEVTEESPTQATVSFNWQVSSYPNRPPDYLEAFVFLDKDDGEPAMKTQIWSSGPLTRTSNWSDTVTVDVKDRVKEPGTYYLKLAVWADITSTNGNCDIDFDNALMAWEKREDKYPNDGPSIQPKDSFASPDIYQWHSFQETAIKGDNTEIFYQLSEDDGNSWLYWDSKTWAKAESDKQYNPAKEINEFISQFPTTNKQLIFKAFLVSDGAHQVSLDNVRIDYLIVGGSGYYLLGTFESSTYDTSAADPNYNYLSWTADTPNGTRLEWQIRTADTEGNLGTAVWSGPNGTGAMRYTTPGQTITTNGSATGTRWIQYKAYLYSNSISTPIIKDVSIDYEL